jgi:ubiquitin-conjugating enzyme E2 J2
VTHAPAAEAHLEHRFLSHYVYARFVRNTVVRIQTFRQLPPLPIPPTEPMSKQAVKRLSTELKAIVAAPPPLADARPDENHLLTWYFVLDGAPGTPYEGGEFVGQLIFPEQYPFKPPGIKMLTPSGRFKTHTRLCFSMSDYHPEEWSPMWGVSQIVTGLNSFMNEDSTTTGSISTSEGTKRQLARESHAFNVNLPEYKLLFPIRYAAAVDRIAVGKLQAAEEAKRKSESPIGAVASRWSQFVISWRGLVLSAGVSILAAVWAAHHGWLTASSATTAASLNL